MNKTNNSTAQKKINTDIRSTQLKGLRGIYESALRKFRNTMFIISLIPIYFLAVIIMGISLLPLIYIFNFLNEISVSWLPIAHYFFTAISIAIGFLAYGFTLIFVTPFFNFIIPLKLKPFRGPYFSYQSLPWFLHNALIYLVRYTFLEFITPTPLNILFYKMMGMKIGRGVHINTTNISDAALIELEDKVTIGGSAHIICHYAAKGYLVIAPVKIKKGATIGIKATIMGDSIVGENALISPHEVVLPKSRIPAGYTRRKTDKDIPLTI